MFSRSLLLSFLVVAACNSPSAAPPSPPPKPVVSVAPAAKPEPAAAVPQPSAPAPSAHVVSAPKSSSQATGLSVKRFVVASEIENREPLQIESVELGQLPLFAFAELANAGGRDQVVITFEREGSSDSVGHVELVVPAATQRWRTWGKTNLIDKPGRWNAVLRDGSGKELARTPFEVMAAARS